MRFKLTIIAVFLLALIVLSLYSFFDAPATTGLPSYRLTTQKTKNGNTTKVDYVDESGNITFAADKHYASIIRTYENGHVILEQYFDADGNPAVQPRGYCALARHYNTDGLVDVIHYLDERGEPITTKSGFNNTRRAYTGDDANTDTYYIDDEQVRNKSGYYSLHRSYNEKKQITEISYLDQNGEPTPHKNGYARITRTYDDDGRIAYEYYFDESGAPVSILSGYYGLYREYDEFGHATLITYLDADGHPINVSKGYASVIQTYAYDGSRATVRYFNAEGKPVTRGRGQYGVEYRDGRKIYLDEDGEPMLRIDNFLDTHPFIVLLAGLVLTAAAVLWKQESRVALLIAYVLFIIVMTIWYRETGDSRSQFQVFWSYRKILTSDSLRKGIINNIWLFVPLGAALYSPSHPHRWVLAIGLSLIIEALQLVFGIGLCEIDDVISNGLGAILGYGLSEVVFQFRKDRKRKLDRA